MQGRCAVPSTVLYLIYHVIFFFFAADGRIASAVVETTTYDAPVESTTFRMIDERFRPGDYHEKKEIKENNNNKKPRLAPTTAKDVIFFPLPTWGENDDEPQVHLPHFILIWPARIRGTRRDPSRKHNPPLLEKRRFGECSRIWFRKLSTPTRLVTKETPHRQYSFHSGLRMGSDISKEVESTQKKKRRKERKVRGSTHFNRRTGRISIDIAPLVLSLFLVVKECNLAFREGCSRWRKEVINDVLVR